MSDDENNQSESTEKGDDDQSESTEKSDEGSSGDEQHAPSADDLSDEGKEKVKQMTEAYDDDRETVALPGTDNTITGVAVNEWIDDDGNPKFGKDKDNDDADGDSHEDADAKHTEDADAKHTEDAGEKQTEDAS